jgi:hypothetical protein
MVVEAYFKAPSLALWTYFPNEATARRQNSYPLILALLFPKCFSRNRAAPESLSRLKPLFIKI